MAKHSNGHIIEMSKSFALESIRGIHIFEYRLVHELPEDKVFGNKFFRDDIDFHCFLNQCRRLEKAIKMGCNVWVKSKEKENLQDALILFKKETPYLSYIRNIYEHFDDYLLQKGKDRTIDTKSMRVYSVEYEKINLTKRNGLTLMLT